MWKRYRWRVCCVLLLTVGSGASAQDSHKLEPERYSTLVKHAIQLHPSDVTFDVPRSWAVDYQIGRRNMNLTRGDLKQFRQQWGLGGGDIVDAVLNFSDCAFEFQDADKHFGFRAYVTDQPTDIVLKRIRERAVKPASKLAYSKRDVRFHESMEGPWQHLRIEIDRWFGDYGIVQDFDFYLRHIPDQRLLAMVVSSYRNPAADPPVDDPIVGEQRQALLKSVVVPQAPKEDRDPLSVEQNIPSSKQPCYERVASVRVVSIRFVSGGGFGCGPYCSAEIQVGPGRVTLIERPLQERQQQNPQKYRELKVDADLSGKHWQELQKLIDHDALFALPDTIPCGCTGDEGSETLEVTFSDHTKKAVNSTGAPKGFETLFEKLFALQAKLQRELPPGWDK